MYNRVNDDFGPGFHSCDSLRGSQSKVGEGFFVDHEVIDVMTAEDWDCCCTCFLDPFARSSTSGRSESIRSGTRGSRVVILCWSGRFDHRIYACRTVSFEMIKQGEEVFTRSHLCMRCYGADAVSKLALAKFIILLGKCGVESEFFYYGFGTRLPRLLINRNKVNEHSLSFRGSRVQRRYAV
jgi:hypothetical protein